jgi:hypothetical protein
MEKKYWSMREETEIRAAGWGKRTISALIQLN